MTVLRAKINDTLYFDHIWNMEGGVADDTDFMTKKGGNHKLWIPDNWLFYKVRWELLETPGNCNSHLASGNMSLHVRLPLFVAGW